MLFTKVRDVKSPSRGTSESAGLDFYVPNDFETVHLAPGGSVNIPSGIKVIIPYGFSGNFYNKSGIGKKGLLVGACVVDSDYRGEVHLNVHNVSMDLITIEPGMKLVQMLIQPVIIQNPMEITNKVFDKQANTERGEGGFGSTGGF